MRLLFKISFVFCIVVFSLSCTQVKVPFTVAPVFSDHMVLQQQSLVPVWGKGIPGTTLVCESSWGSRFEIQVEPDGSWRAELETPEYGGPYTLSLSSETDLVTFKDVFVGEVWLTSGQSNMEWPMKSRILNREEEIKSADFPEIRMFTVPRDLNGTNINAASWKVASPENAVNFSAVGYFFAREIHKKLGVPVGILNSSWGGTRVEAWTSIEKLAALDASREEAEYILSQGGLEGLQQNTIQKNKEIQQSNSNYLRSKSYAIPSDKEAWETLDLDDLEFTSPSFDDTNWTELRLESTQNEHFFFENEFNQGNLAENGVVWLRSTFDLEDPSAFSHFVAEGGIDDYDYTYLNGKQIGIGLYCCTDRSYEIPEGLLKKEGNVLAMRVIDVAGHWGFRGDVFLKGAEQNHSLIKEFWKQKHLAFYLNTSIQKHPYSLKELQTKADEIKTNVVKGEAVQNPNDYSILYTKMIQPIHPYKVKGFLWYQGERNVPNPQDYQALFSGMIEDWRQKWGEDLPFYFVQIAPFKYTDQVQSQALRDAQRKTLALNKTGMAITLDIGEENDIHPANKQDVGKRLARLALVNEYEADTIIATGPLLSSFSLFPKHIDLSFEFAGTELISKGRLEGFEIADSDGVFYPAHAEIQGSKVRVSSSKVKNPQKARYGWKNYFDARLFNSDGLPASSFSIP